MATSLRARTRAALVVGTTAVLVTGMASPALAMTGNGWGSTYDDGEERGTPMSGAQVVLVFVILPLAVVGLIWLLARAGSWTSSGRIGADDAWTEQPVAVGAVGAAGAESSDRPGLVESGQAPAVGAAPDDDQAPSTGGTSAGF
ncbi:MAG: hypothetical protein LCI03_08710 [Actinobacteria bacterium]|jgi:hypothetical protein|nr:hypothetical protein [Actinomycetota bacterium]